MCGHNEKGRRGCLPFGFKVLEHSINFIFFYYYLRIYTNSITEMNNYLEAGLIGYRAEI